MKLVFLDGECVEFLLKRVQQGNAGYRISKAVELLDGNCFRPSLCGNDFAVISCRDKAASMAHCRLRPLHPLHDAVVFSPRPSSSGTRRNHYDAAGALACARRRSDVTRCNGICIFGSLCANMTSSISQRRQRRTIYIGWSDVTESLWSRHDRHFVTIRCDDALSKMASICRVIRTKYNQLI